MYSYFAINSSGRHFAYCILPNTHILKCHTKLKTPGSFLRIYYQRLSQGIFVRCYFTVRLILIKMISRILTHKSASGVGSVGGSDDDSPVGSPAGSPAGSGGNTSPAGSETSPARPAPSDSDSD